jgi:uncharacterized protein (TIGR02594 family)
MIPDFLKGFQLPAHMQVAFNLIGTKEIVGAKHNETILQWARDLGLGKVYTNDEMAWCGLFFAHVMKEANRRVELNTKDPYDYLRALKYADMPGATKVAKGDERLGDILIFKRPEGGHIGFYVSEATNSFSVLGGNQGNAVSLTNIAKDRLFACLRPNYISYVPQKHLVNNGVKLSTNEA